MLAMLLIGISCLLVTAMNWQLRKFGEVTYEQILFHMNISLDSETRLLESFLQNTVMVTAIVLVVLYLLFGVKWCSGEYFEKIKRRVLRNKNKIAALVLVFSIVFVFIRLDVVEIVEDYQAKDQVSDFYEKHYNDPRNAEIVSPAKKRNLVLIFLESAPSTIIIISKSLLFATDTKHLPALLVKPVFTP